MRAVCAGHLPAIQAAAASAAGTLPTENGAQRLLAVALQSIADVQLDAAVPALLAPLEMCIKQQPQVSGSNAFIVTWCIVPVCGEDARRKAGHWQVHQIEPGAPLLQTKCRVRPTV